LRGLLTSMPPPQRFPGARRLAATVSFTKHLTAAEPRVDFENPKRDRVQLDDALKLADELG